MIAKVGVDAGERVVALVCMTAYDLDENLVTRYFFNGPVPPPDVLYGSAAEAKAALDAWLSTQEAPNDSLSSSLSSRRSRGTAKSAP